MNPGITKNIRPNITFSRIGLANIDTTIPDPRSKQLGTWTLMRLSSMIQMLNHTGVSALVWNFAQYCDETNCDCFISNLFQKLLDLVAVDSEGAEWGMLEDIVESEIWKQIKQLNVEFHFWGGEGFFLRHARAMSNFLQKTHFLLAKHDHMNDGPMIDLGSDLHGKHVAVNILHFINNDYLPKWDNIKNF